MDFRAGWAWDVIFGGPRGQWLGIAFSLPPLQERVLLRRPKPQRQLGGGQPGGAGFLAGFGAGFCPPCQSVACRMISIPLQWPVQKYDTIVSVLHAKDRNTF